MPGSNLGRFGPSLVLFLGLIGCGDLNVVGADCTDGAAGCVCNDDNACDGALICASGRCAPSACPDGLNGCACADDDSCVPGLRCDDIGGLRLCVCVEGLEGCGCVDEGVCQAADDGTPLECRDDVCSRPTCDLGTLGCLCNPSAEPCDGGLACDDGRCARDTGQTLEPPANPVCYTPCRGGGLGGPDNFRACDADGLLPGCIGGNLCLGGTCAKPQPGGGRVELPGCNSDYHCPSFQTCIDNRCYSDCGADDGAVECRGDRVCHRKVCRLPCVAGADECPEDFWCDAKNGAGGYCAANAIARSGVAGQAAGDEEPPAASFTIEPSSLIYRLVTPEVGALPGPQTLTLTLAHTAEHEVGVTIRPSSHTVRTADDSERVDGNELVNGEPRRPLCWVELRASDGTMTASNGTLSVRIPPGVGLEIEVISSPSRDACQNIANDVGRLNVAAATEWFGTLEITSGDRTDLVTLKAVEPAGRWAGRISFFGNFGTGHVEQWVDALRRDPAAGAAEVRFVENALIRRWWAFRTGVLSLDEFAATISATENDLWRTPPMQAQCPLPAACYPISNLDGYSVYTDDVDAAPIPSGYSELSIALNLRPDAHEGEGDAVAWSGRIDSSVALQYPGNPHVEMAFEGDPNDCFGGAGRGVCPLTSFSSISVIGARFAPTAGACNGVQSPLTFNKVDTPWFQRSFGADADSEGPDGLFQRAECRGTTDPLVVDGEGNPISLPTGDPKIDESLAATNPLADGRPLVRRLELLDGALFDGDQIFILFREALPELFPGAGPSYGYGYMWLQRGDALLEDADFEAVRVPQSFLDAAAADAQNAPSPLVTKCAAGINGDTPRARVDFALTGSAPSADALEVPGNSVHYVCDHTGKIDGRCPVSSEVHFFALDGDIVAQPDLGVPATEDGVAPKNWACNEIEGTCAAGEPCVIGTLLEKPCEIGTDDDRGKLSATCFVDGAAPCEVNRKCPSKGSCDAVLDEWRQEQTQGVLLEPASVLAPGAGDVDGRALIWACSGDNRAWCSQDREDLRTDKTFKSDLIVPGDPASAPLQDLIDTGFSYRTGFRSRIDGGTIGFAPRECLVSSTTSYCYDAEKITRARERIDCLSKSYAVDQVLPVVVRTQVANALRKVFSFDQTFEGGRSLPTIYFGFEYLFSELMITLGDQAYAESFVTRFDLAGELVARFPGDRLEPGGEELSGAAGYEVFLLYLAAQSYQVALDRFIGLGDVVGKLLNPAFPHERLIDASVATTWFKKLLRASAQKARISARIAERYHRLGKANLARHVVRRAYAAAWLESIYFSQLMKQLFDRSTALQKTQVQKEIETAQLVYKDALLVMRGLNDTINDDVTFFGFTTTYVPSPALDPGGPNAFELLLERARGKAEVALVKEVNALADRRAFETDEAEFLSTLTDLAFDADGQLAELCGFIEVPDDGGVSVVPATSDNAHQSPDPRIRALGDPCGLAGNGALFEAYLGLADTKDDLKAWQQEYAHIQGRISDEQEQLSEQCDRIIDFADWRAGVGGAVVALKSVQVIQDALREQIEGKAVTLNTMAGVANCTMGFSTNCIGKATSTSMQVAIGGLKDGAQAFLRGLSAAAELAEAGISEVAIPIREIREECEAAIIDSKFAVRDLFRELISHGGSGASLLRRVQGAAGEVQHLRDMAICIQATATEQRQLTVDIESARNDPNVRIYRNSAIIEAERTFDGAVRAAWRATRGFEYFTNQTYGPRERLPLVRMVGNGDVTLEAYLDELDDAFNDFDEAYGNPDLRVQTISLKQQAVGALSAEGLPLAEDDTGDLFRAFLQAPQLRDADGFITIPFRTGLADPSTFPESGPVLTQVSPLTHNHKVRFIEIELVGGETGHGDDLARVYVRQGADGVGQLREPGGQPITYVFPQRTAVIDVSFNGERPLEEALRNFEGATASPYRSDRLRDRPLHHTKWSLILHPSAEPVNRDFDMVNWLTDIKIHLWYTDFTEL